MAGTSALIFFLSTVLLIHSAYSAYEYAHFRKHLPTGSSLGAPIPLDIKIEAYFGVIAACIGAVVSVIGTLKPIKFSKSVAELEAKGKNPFTFLEVRPGFQDIAAKREEFSKWKKTQSK